MRCEELRDLVPLHLTGLLEEEEAAGLREHLDGGCPRCAAEVAAIAATLEELPYSLPLEEPSPMVKARLLARVRRESEAAAQSPARWPRTAIAAIAAAVIAAVLSGIVVARRDSAALGDLREQIGRQREQLARQDAEMAGLRDQMEKARETIRLVSAPGVVGG